MTKYLAIFFSSLAALALVVMGYLAFFNDGRNACGGSAIAGGKAAIGGPFELIDQTGKLRRETDVINGHTLIYFGYTFCPDVCPFDVARNMAAVDILASQGMEVTPVFITIDPARDTKEALADYAFAMHPKLIALTGSDEQIKKASSAYKVYARKNGEDEDYLMDHSTFTYLMNKEGLVEFFRRDILPEDMADKIACYVEGRNT